MRNTIYATFNDPKMAEKAAGALMDHGLLAQDLSIIQSHRWSRLDTEEFPNPQPEGMLFVVPNSSGMSTGLSPFGIGPMVEAVSDIDVAEPEVDALSTMEVQAKIGISTTTPEDALSGAWQGTAVGAGIGILATLAALFVPGVGLIVGGGALATAIAGVAGTMGAGAAAGALAGYLKDQGVESHIVAEYEHKINTGGAVLGATLPSGGVDEGHAWEILNKYAGQHVTSYENRPYVS